MRGPKVSVLLTSYNHERYLCEAVESVLAQSFTDFELIISDDCSTDASREILQGYDDARIRLLLWDKNSVCQNHFVALRRAKGQYVAMIHSDDVWHRDKLRQQVEFLEKKPRFGAVFSRVQAINEESEPCVASLTQVFSAPNRSRREWLRTFFESGNMLCHPSVCFRREFMDDVYPKSTGMRQIPDFWGWVRLCQKAEIFILDQPLVQFRVHGNLSNTSSATADNIIRYQNELTCVLDQFLRIKNVEDWLRIFPEMAEYVVSDRIDLEYAFARLCVNKKDSLPHVKFGLDMLYRMLADERRGPQVREMYGFGIGELSALSAECDVYGVWLQYENKKLKEALANMKHIMKMQAGVGAV